MLRRIQESQQLGSGHVVFLRFVEVKLCEFIVEICRCIVETVDDVLEIPDTGVLIDVLEECGNFLPR